MSQHFIDRKEELEFIERRYKSKKAEFIVLYGRRRIGKTELILKILESKKGIYFLASKEGDRENIRNFSAEAAKFLGDKTFADAEFKDWFSLFKFLVDNVSFNRILKYEKIIIAIDEFPFLIHSNKSIPSIFQRIWELIFRHKNIMLILSGSAVSVMESDVISPKSPLYGRRTGEWQVQPINFHYLKDFLPSYSTEDLMNVWFVVGGVPEYLWKFESDKPFFQNIKDNILMKGTYLYREAEVLLNEEFREPKNYKLIFKALSLGYNTLGGICNYTGLDKSMVSKYLDVLDKLKMINEELPITASKKSKKRVYSTSDPYFHFWFRYVYPNRIDLEAIRYEEVTRLIKHDFSLYAGRMFEKLIEHLIRNKILLSNFSFERIGRWWHKDKEIDIVALDEETKKILFCECKWRNNVNAENIFEELKEKAKYVEWNNDRREEYFAVFAKSFKHSKSSVDFKKKVKEENVMLFDLKGLEKICIL